MIVLGKELIGKTKRSLLLCFLSYFNLLHITNMHIKVLTTRIIFLGEFYLGN